MAPRKESPKLPRAVQGSASDGSFQAGQRQVEGIEWPGNLALFKVIFIVFFIFVEWNIHHLDPFGESIGEMFNFFGAPTVGKSKVRKRDLVWC